MVMTHILGFQILTIYRLIFLCRMCDIINTFNIWGQMHPRKGSNESTVDVHLSVLKSEINLSFSQVLFYQSDS